MPSTAETSRCQRAGTGCRRPAIARPKGGGEARARQNNTERSIDPHEFGEEVDLGVGTVLNAAVTPSMWERYGARWTSWLEAHARD